MSAAVIYSEFASPTIKAKCLKFGADAVFLKPELKEFVAFLDGFAD